MSHLECDVKSTPRLQCMLSLPLSTAIINLDSRNPCAVVVEHNMDHITSLERSLCSNFFCCGLQLADFHALLDHFEENHVVVLAPNGKRVYPREGLRAVPLDPASGSCTPSSSRASSVSPASPLSPQTPLSPPLSRKSSFTVPPVYTPFTPSLPVDPADPLLDSSEIDMSQVPDFDFSVQPSFFPPLTPEITTPEPSSSSEDEGISSPASPTTAEDTTPLNVRFIPTAGGEKRKMDRPMSKSAKSRRHHPSGASHSKRREKMYRCPKNGCVKAYLNPNGLKYHLEKGTCKFAEDEDDGMHERTVPLKRSRPASPLAPVTDRAYQSQGVTTIEERSRVNDDSDAPFRGGDAAAAAANTASHTVGPSPNSNYGHHPWGTYPRPVEATTTQCEEHHPSSPQAPSVLPLPPQPCSPRSLLGQSAPQYMTAQPPQFHYPVPTYPNGYIYAQQQQQQQQYRSYYASSSSELATYETSASLLASGRVAPPSSQ